MKKAGTAAWSDYVGKHYVENRGNATVTIVLTEIKALQELEGDIAKNPSHRQAEKRYLPTERPTTNESN